MRSGKRSASEITSVGVRSWRLSWNIGRMDGTRRASKLEDFLDTETGLRMGHAIHALSVSGAIVRSRRTEAAAADWTGRKDACATMISESFCTCR